MGEPRVVFDHVWKQFARGEQHDSLRDLIPSLIRQVTRWRQDGGAQQGAGRPEAFWALQDVTFEVSAGEALGIIGRNGAGKSTILKLLTRILKPTRGMRRLSGRTGALIEVAAGFHPDLTGRENIYLQGAIMGMRRAEIAAHFDEIVSFADLEPFIDTPVKRYSSGMNARLGFSIAAHLNPDVLLIDEVLSVGDMAFQEKCQARMKQFRANGVAIVFVSHHLPTVAQLCSEVLLLEGGRPIRIGAPGDVIAAYCRGTGGSDSGDVAIAATLRANRRTGVDAFEIEPGERLTLDVTLEFHVDVERANVGVAVWDLTRDLCVYSASSDFIGVPLVQAGRGETKQYSFSFDANLTRGLYALEVNVVDFDRHRFLGRVRGIRHFQVVERVSYDGVANLYLKGREVSALTERGAPLRALAR